MGVKKVTWPEAEKWAKGLTSLVRTLRNREPSSKLGVGTGWSSEKTLFDFPHAHALRDFISSAMPPAPDGYEWELSGWANVIERGDRLAPHDHRNSHLGGENDWAGVFYLSGDAPLTVSGEEILPEPGLLVIFPALAIHEVKPSKHDDARISIGFNARKVLVVEE